MATEPSSNQERKQELIDALRTARNTVRVQLHLFSLEAKERWHDLEKQLSSLESKLEREGESIADSIGTTVEGLVEATKKMLRGVDGALDTSAPISAIMSRDPTTCSPSDSLARAAQIMWETDCGAVPVVNPDGVLVGIVTDRDICMATYTRGQVPSALDVESTMAKTVYRAAPGDSIARVAGIMGRYQVHRLPVVENGRVVGIVSLADLARYVRSAKQDNLPACVLLAHTLGRISERRESKAEPMAAE